MWTAGITQVEVIPTVLAVVFAFDTNLEVSNAIEFTLLGLLALALQWGCGIAGDGGVIAVGLSIRALATSPAQSVVEAAVVRRLPGFHADVVACVAICIAVCCLLGLALD